MSLHLAVRRLHYVPPWAIGGSLLTVIGSGLLTTFDVHTSKGKWIGYQILAGLGRGAALNMVSSPTFLPLAEPVTDFFKPIISVQEEMSGNAIAVATGAIALFQYIAGSIAITIAQTIFQNLLGPALSRHTVGIDVQMILDSGATGFRAITPPDQLVNVLDAYNEALVKVFVSKTIKPSEDFAYVAPVYTHCHRCSGIHLELWFSLDQTRTKRQGKQR
jgi:hypothetical protein